MSAAAEAKSQRGPTDLQKRFADLWAEALAAGATFTNAEIAEAAGYSGSKQVLEVTASRTLSHPTVREYLHGKAKQYLREGAFPAAVTLRKLSEKATSERVRADVASRLAVGLGLIEGEGSTQGQGVTIQLIFKHSNGTLLTQPPAPTAQAHVIEHDPAPEHSLAEGEVGAGGQVEGVEGGSRKGGRGGRVGAKTTRASPSAPSPHVETPKNSRGRK